PPPDRIHYVQARLQMRRGRFADAAALLDQLRTAAVRSPALYRQANHLLAQCCEQLNDANGELTAFQRILDNDPNAGGVRLEFIRALARHGRPDDSLAQFLTMVQRPEVSSRAVVETARALIDRAGRDPKAWAALEKKIDALKIDDVNPNTALTRAALDLARHRPADSLPAVERLVKAQPRNTALHLDVLAHLRPDSLPAREALCLIALRAGDEPRRQATLREIEAIEGKDGATGHLLEAQRLLWLAAPGDAAALALASAKLDAAAKLRPGDPVIEFLAGRVDELAGRADEALKHYQAA